MACYIAAKNLTSDISCICRVDATFCHLKNQACESAQTRQTGLVQPPKGLWDSRVQYSFVLSLMQESMVKHKDWRGPAWYEGTQSCVRTRGLTSEYFSVNRGVIQGSVLSPTLFLLVINSLAIGVSIPVRPWPEHIWTLSWVFCTYRWHWNNEQQPTKN